MTGDISATEIKMLRGLTQGVMSSLALFKIFIDHLPKALRVAMQESGVESAGMDPIRIVADDVIGVTTTAEGLKELIQVCVQWAGENGLEWNPHQDASAVAEPHDAPTSVQIGGNST